VNRVEFQNNEKVQKGHDMMLYGAEKHANMGCSGWLYHLISMNTEAR
jgi:hypothetical protein